MSARATVSNAAAAARAKAARCEMCGERLEPSPCSSCPLTAVTSCKGDADQLCCPRCGWKAPPETSLSRLIKKIFGGEA